jgi:hypothetical protein
MGMMDHTHHKQSHNQPNDSLGFEGAELVVDDLPDDLVGGRHLSSWIGCLLNGMGMRWGVCWLDVESRWMLLGCVRRCLVGYPPSHRSIKSGCPRIAAAAAAAAAAASRFERRRDWSRVDSIDALCVQSKQAANEWDECEIAWMANALRSRRREEPRRSPKLRGNGLGHMTLWGIGFCVLRVCQSIDRKAGGFQCTFDRLTRTLCGSESIGSAPLSSGRGGRPPDPHTHTRTRGVVVDDDAGWGCGGGGVPWDIYAVFSPIHTQRLAHTPISIPHHTTSLAQVRSTGPARTAAAAG